MMWKVVGEFIWLRLVTIG